MLRPGQTVRVNVEKPAAGGRMIARVDGQVVLVGGAIPGERVTARIDRVARGLAYADAVAIDEPSADRRAAAGDPRCGGSLYGHIEYRRQLALKSLIIADAFARIGRIALPSTVGVAPSPEEGYRMRARLHVRGGRIGFFREGTHEICDARSARQLLPATCDVVERVAAALKSLRLEAVREVDVSENIEASERVVHLDAAPPLDERTRERLTTGDGLVAGPHVTDVLTIDGKPIALRRHVLAFFQGNRYLLHDLVAHVVWQIPTAARVVDLYAGVGLFSVAAAAVRSAEVTAVEGDRFAAADLEANGAASGARVRAIHELVEGYVDRVIRRQREAADRPDTIVVDPPRTGMSREALTGAIGLDARRVVYVSCDVATLARDARRLADAGYAIVKIDAFDMFPNTPHVETVAVMDRGI